MLSIRLSRIGKKKQPVYRLIVLDNRKDPWGDFIENLGTYNPRKTPSEIKLKTDRIKYWIGVGAQPSVTVHNLLIDEKIIEGKKVKATSPKKKELTEEEKKAAAQASTAKTAETAPKPEEANPPVSEETKPEEPAAPAETPADTDKEAKQTN